MAQTQYETYEDSVLALATFAQGMFGHVNPESREALTYENAVEITEHGNAKGAYVGTNAYVIYWMPCPECLVPQMN